MPSWPGAHGHHPCVRCGYTTRYKQYLMACACTAADLRPQPPLHVSGNTCGRCAGDPRMPKKNISGPQEDLEVL